jgi:hypothetical protein
VAVQGTRMGYWGMAHVSLRCSSDQCLLCRCCLIKAPAVLVQTYCRHPPRHPSPT